MPGKHRQLSRRWSAVFVGLAVAYLLALLVVYGVHG